jgi:hypothetical protein
MGRDTEPTQMRYEKSDGPIVAIKSGPMTRKERRREENPTRRESLMKIMQRPTMVSFKGHLYSNRQPGAYGRSAKGSEGIESLERDWQAIETYEAREQRDRFRLWTP